MKKLMTLLVIATLAMGLISAAQAIPTGPTTITVTGKAHSNVDSDFGYTEGQSYSFTWVINSDFADNEWSYPGEGDNMWADENVSDTPVFTSFYGDGLLGTYVRPTLDDWNPYSYIEQVTDCLTLYSGNDGEYSIGLTGKSFVIRSMWASDIVADGFSNVPSASFVSPSAYYAARAGVYDVTGSMYLYSVGTEYQLFDAKSMTIATAGGSPVPEPGTILAALSILGPAGMMFRRRKA